MRIKRRSIKIIALLLFSFFSIYNTAQWGASFSYVMLPFFIFIIACFLEPLQLKKRALLIFLVYFEYLASTLFSNYVSVDRDFLSFAIFCIFYILAVSFDYQSSDLKAFVLCYIAIGFSVSCNICYQWLTKHYVQIWLQRSSFFFWGQFKDPNYVMAYVAPSVILSVIVFFYSENKIIKILMALNAVISVFSCLVASSRAGIVAIALALLTMMIFSEKMKFKAKVGIVFVLIGAFFLGRFFVLNYYNQYALDRLLHDSDGAGRLEIWRQALEVFLSHPFLGGGLNSGSTISSLFLGYTTHSILIDVICDSGIVGFSTIMVFLYLNCLKSQRKNRSFVYVFAIACLIPLLFINGFNTTTMYHPLIIMSIFNKFLEHDSFISFVRFEAIKKTKGRVLQLSCNASRYSSSKTGEV